VTRWSDGEAPAQTVLAATLLWVTPVSAIAAQADGWDSTRSRREAQEILSERRFRGIETPRPLEGVFRRIASWLRSIGDFFRDIAEHLPGGGWTLVAIVGIALAGLIAVVVLRGAQRRQRTGAGGSSRAPAPASEDPQALENGADDAARRGDFDSAVRLRFRAGLLRLDRARAIEFRPSMTTGEVAGRLASRVFDELATSFEAIAYGGRRAGAADVDDSRTGWTRLLSQMASR
jgi:hypothetical protein